VSHHSNPKRVGINKRLNGHSLATAIRGGHTGPKDKCSGHDLILWRLRRGGRVATNKGQANCLQAGKSGSMDFPVTNKAAGARKAIAAQIGSEGDSVMASWPLLSCFYTNLVARAGKSFWPPRGHQMASPTRTSGLSHTTGRCWQTQPQMRAGYASPSRLEIVDVFFP
jgi:hypothetical protein